MHGTLRREDGSRRSVLPGIRVILASARAVRRAPRHSAGPDGGRTARPNTCWRRFRLARALMVTPWFAASAGIVIAAALAVDSPAALTYVPNGPGVRCPASGCAGSAPGQLHVATASPGVKLRTGRAPSAATPASPGRRRAAGAVYLLSYQVARHWQGGFVAVITFPDDLRPGPWSLRLAFPSARVDQVWGARWQPSGNGHAGTATGFWPEPRGHDGGVHGQQDMRGQDGRQLVILATGTPASPSGCRLDRASCDFRR
jgi:hypothetical protein